MIVQGVVKPAPRLYSVTSSARASRGGRDSSLSRLRRDSRFLSAHLRVNTLRKAM
jgi:hypothetical protein